MSSTTVYFIYNILLPHISDLKITFIVWKWIPR